MVADKLANWSSFTSREGVDFMVALSTWTSSQVFFKVFPPTDREVMCQRLTTPHRNCQEISSFLKFYVQHLGGIYLSGTEEDQQARYLPPGRLSVWVERSQGVTDDQVLNFIKENYLGGANLRLSVTVLQSGANPSATAEQWCGERKWRHLADTTSIVGSEDQCIVLLDPETTVPEFISRGRNLLVIVTTRGKLGLVTLCPPPFIQFGICRYNNIFLDAASQHESPAYKCRGGFIRNNFNGDCPYIGQQLLQKVSVSIPSQELQNCPTSHLAHTV